MADKIKELFHKVLEWWNHFSTKQKTFIISAGAGVILALAILVTVLTRPQYTLLRNCDTTKEASQIAELLDGEGLDYKVSDDAYQISINKKQLSQANLLLASNNIQANSYTIDNVTSGGFSTTESDKQKRYELYMETRLAQDLLATFSFVKTAVVDLYIPENDGTLISQQEDASAWVVLELSEEIPPETAAGIAKAIAVSVGNKTEENIVIMDTQGNTLYSGSDNYSVSGTASSQLSVKSQWENKVKNDVRQVVMGTNQFDKVEVAVNLDVDFSTSSQTDHEFYVADGQTQGYLSSERIYSSEATNGNSDVPGTDSNGNQEYVYQDNSQSSSTTSEEERKYTPSERITDKQIPAGTVNYTNSSISCAFTKIVMVREDDVKAQGLLDGVTWEEYKLANEGQTVVTVDQSFYDMVSKATGFPTDNISIVAYSENMFIDSEGLGISATDIMTIVLIVGILALLVFVVLRSMRGEKTSEEPEELAVETLLQSQPEVEIENISTEQMSETRKMIEKFVDENPEAAASLLRNWLNEDWG